MSRQLRVVSAIVSFTLGAALLIPVHNSLADGSAQTILKARHDHYHRLGDAFKNVRDASRGGSTDWDALERAAQTVSDASVNQARWFPEGSGPQAGKTRALAEIWSKPQQFAAAQQNFSEAAPQLLEAVKARDLTRVRSQFAQVGQTCKHCHDNFRGPEK